MFKRYFFLGCGFLWLFLQATFNVATCGPVRGAPCRFCNGSLDCNCAEAQEQEDAVDNEAPAQVPDLPENTDAARAVFYQINEYRRELLRVGGQDILENRHRELMGRFAVLYQQAMSAAEMLDPEILATEQENESNSWHTALEILAAEGLDDGLDDANNKDFMIRFARLAASGNEAYSFINIQMLQIFNDYATGLRQDLADRRMAIRMASANGSRDSHRSPSGLSSKRTVNKKHKVVKKVYTKEDTRKNDKSDKSGKNGGKNKKNRT